MSKRGAMELSVGTIVVIVLSMTMLILGVILVQNIFSGATDITDMTNDQIKDQISKLFGEEEKLIIYPDSKSIEATVGEEASFAVGIQHLLKNAGDVEFSYDISIADTGSCSMSENDLIGLIVTGDSLSGTLLSPGGDPVVRKVTLSIPEGVPLCSFSYKIQAYSNGGSAYAADFMDVTITS